MTHRLRVPNCRPRPILRSILRGARDRCPACGGRDAVLEGYLRIRPACPHCGEPFGHIKADDGPAYFTVLVAGHVTVSLALAVEQAWHPPLEVQMAAGVILLGLLIWRLLPRMKGAVLGLMWAHRLKGDEVQGDLDL